MKLPRLYEFFAPGQIITLQEMKSAMGTQGNTLRQRISQLGARGYLRPLRQGLYVVQAPAGDATDAGAVRDPQDPFWAFAMASRLTPTAHLGYVSALTYHAGETPPVGSTILVCSATSFHAFEHGEGDGMFRYGFVKQRPQALKALTIFDKRCAPNSIRVSPLEQCLVDGLARPQHCRDLDLLVTLAHAIDREPDADTVLQAALAWGTLPVLHRLGMFTELMRGHWPGLHRALALSLRPHLSPKTQAWPVRGNGLDSLQSKAMRGMELGKRTPGAKQESPRSGSPSHEGLCASWKVQLCPPVEHNDAKS